MRYVIFWTIALTVLFYITSHNADAADWSAKFGPGIIEGTPDFRTKRLSLRREEYIFYGVSWAAEVGGYTDLVGHGRRGAGSARVQLGITTGPETGIYGKFFTGPGIITQPDTLLGGRFPQFCTDFGIGIRDQYTLVGVGLEHISSAGIFTPNAGRNYITMEAGLRF